LNCFDALDYSTIIIADPELRFTKKEIIKLRKDIEKRGLNLILYAEWSEKSLMEKHQFTSNFTGEEWKP
jgi:hypothetical protein